MRKTPFSKEAAKFSLSARERRDLRARLVSYMEYHPLALPVPRPRRHTAAHQILNSLRALRAQVRLRPLAGALAVLVLVAVPVAAEYALPGDTLYPVKVRFNEGVRSSLALSPYEKLEWESARVERRISEARLLADEGRLTAETQESLAATVREHTAAAQKQIVELSESDASGAAIAAVTLESALEVQTAVLSSDASTTTEAVPVGTDSRVIVAALRTASSDVASTTEAGTAPSYERLVARIEEDTTRIHALRAGLAGTLGDALSAEIDTRMVRIDDAIIAAQAAHDAGEEERALKTLRQALAISQKLIAFMSDIDVRSKVSLDTLLPEIDRDVIEQHLAALTARRDVLTGGLADTATTTREEVGEYLVAFEEALEPLELAVTEGNFEAAAKNIAAAALQLAAAEALVAEEEELPLGQQGGGATTTPQAPVSSATSSTPAP